MRTVMITGNPWIITTNNQIGGGSFNTGDRAIELGTLYKGWVLETLMHEISESIAVERGYRYDKYDSNNGRVFMFTHEDFQNFIKDLTASIAPMVIKNPLSAFPKRKCLTMGKKYATKNQG